MSERIKENVLEDPLLEILSIFSTVYPGEVSRQDYKLIQRARGILTPEESEYLARFELSFDDASYEHGWYNQGS